MATQKFAAVDFAQEYPVMLMDSPIVVGAGTDTEVAAFMTQQGHYFEVRYEQANSDITFTKNAQGWIIPNDNTDNEGIEISQGTQATTTPMFFTLGTDPGFFIDVVFDIPDVSDYDVAYVGFVTNAAYADAINTPAALLGAYTNMMGINVNAGDLFALIATSDGSVADTATDTTANWADGEQNRIRIEVSTARVITYRYTVGGNGTLTSTLTSWGTTYTGVSGQVVRPAMIFTKGAGASDTPPILVNYRCGLL